jgi:hypothetical protein
MIMPNKKTMKPLNFQLNNFRLDIIISFIKKTEKAENPTQSKR